MENEHLQTSRRVKPQNNVINLSTVMLWVKNMFSYRSHWAVIVQVLKEREHDSSQGKVK